MAMDERMLLLLGLLKAQSQHGYQINEFIEHNLKRVIDMKRSTAYSLLDRLCEQGYAESSMQQHGNRPPKKVYILTPQGEEAFQETLHTLLTEAESVTFPFEIALMFLDQLSETEIHAALQQRLLHVEQYLTDLESAPIHKEARGVDLAFAHRRALLRAEHAWLEEIIASPEVIGKS
ncbi:MAG: PadR family transcriptional regulator [Ktedonobacteraceae bacterium]